jgi:BCD family chlorophyll transporter-like MFS transporter
LAGGTLIGFAFASRVLSRGVHPSQTSLTGALIGIPGFAAIIFSAYGGGTAAFLTGTLMIGLGAGLFGHSTLTATMRAAPKENVGLALGAWGSVQATAAGVGMALAGWVRDLILALPSEGGQYPRTSVRGWAIGTNALFCSIHPGIGVPCARCPHNDTASCQGWVFQHPAGRA